MNLHEKLLEIQKSVAYLKKENKGFQYQYVSSSQTLGTVRAKMDELKVLLVPEGSISAVTEYHSKNDGVQFLTGIMMKFTWIDVENPADKMTCDWYAQGADNGEKGVGKAYTYGEKYFLLKFFHIATDKDDPDAFQNKAERANASRKPSKAIAPSLASKTPASAPPAPPEPTLPPNPWKGYVNRVNPPESGEHDGTPWTRWDVVTDELTVSAFEKDLADIAADACDDQVPVEIVWKLQKSKKTGVVKCTMQTIRVLSAEEIAGMRV